jgi:hypothetical protein
MRISIRLAAAAMVPFIVGFGSGSGNDDFGSPDSGPDTDAGADSDTDGDTDSDSDSDGDDYCDDVEFPPSNGPDGCKRILLTKTPDGIPFLNEASGEVAISRDGSLAVFGVFYSDYEEDGLPEDTNGKDDIYAVDLNTNEIEIISVSSSGELFNASSYSPSVSADGRNVGSLKHVFLPFRSPVFRPLDALNGALNGVRIFSSPKRLIGFYQPHNRYRLMPSVNRDGLNPF